MRFSPLGPSKRVYLVLAAVCLLAAGPAQWLVERGRREALGPPREKLAMVELWPILMGGFRGPMIAALAYYAQQKEIEADIYGTRSSIRALIELQPEFDHLWIYHSWVIAYNLTAVASPPEERYTTIRDGIAFLEEGVQRIASLYEGRKPFVNDRCPITRRPIHASDVTPGLIRPFEGLPVALFDDGAVASWDSLPDSEKAIRLEGVRDATPEYKRKRATLLYMIGWTYYQKLAHGKEPKQYYRRWYIRDTGTDPFQQAHRYLSLASAVDVPPSQISYHVLKTAPVHCQTDWARALAEDPKAKIQDVVIAFDRVDVAWEETLPFVRNRKAIKGTLEQMALVIPAMRDMARAEEMATVGDDKKADAFLSLAKGKLDTLRVRQPQAAYQQIYDGRLELTRKHVAALLGGEAP